MSMYVCIYMVYKSKYYKFKIALNWLRKWDSNDIFRFHERGLGTRINLCIYIFIYSYQHYSIDTYFCIQINPFHITTLCPLCQTLLHAQWGDIWKNLEFFLTNYCKSCLSGKKWTISRGQRFSVKFVGNFQFKKCRSIWKSDKFPNWIYSYHRCLPICIDNFWLAGVMCSDMICTLPPANCRVYLPSAVSCIMCEVMDSVLLLWNSTRAYRFLFKFFHCASSTTSSPW